MLDQHQAVMEYHTAQAGSPSGKVKPGHSWDKEQRALASPVPTVTGDLELRGGTPCPVQARTVFDLAAQVRQEPWAVTSRVYVSSSFRQYQGGQQ